MATTAPGCAHAIASTICCHRFPIAVHAITTRSGRSSSPGRRKRRVRSPARRAIALVAFPHACPSTTAPSQPGSASWLTYRCPNCSTSPARRDRCRTSGLRGERAGRRIAIAGRTRAGELVLCVMAGGQRTILGAVAIRVVAVSDGRSPIVPRGQLPCLVVGVGVRRRSYRACGTPAGDMAIGIVAPSAQANTIPDGSARRGRARSAIQRDNSACSCSDSTISTARGPRCDIQTL
jgi:hypothetical protein